ncbi:MAG TPA: hypothetical protein VK784_04275, partial [Pseudonocardiaceae bacterium]|nr:hypothetical protein [Pseudonocardiaceae bacterium]
MFYKTTLYKTAFYKTAPTESVRTDPQRFLKRRATVSAASQVEQAGPGDSLGMPASRSTRYRGRSAGPLWITWGNFAGISSFCLLRNLC